MRFHGRPLPLQTHEASKPVQPLTPDPQHSNGTLGPSQGLHQMMGGLEPEKVIAGVDATRKAGLDPGAAAGSGVRPGQGRRVARFLLRSAGRERGRRQGCLRRQRETPAAAAATLHRCLRFDPRIDWCDCCS